MILFDSHAHLDMRDYEKGDVEGMLAKAWDEGLIGIVAMAGSTRVCDFAETFALADREERIWTAAGIHPHAASFATPSALEKLRLGLDRERMVALGEIGLDYHYNHSTPVEQRRAFVNQLRMSHEAELPVVIHTRNADEDTISILKDEGVQELGGVIHCFSSGVDLARSAVELGLFVSFSGIVTFPKAEPVREAALAVPLDRILAETDSPFLSPAPHRGRRNEPARVRNVVEKLAEIRELDPEEMAEITTRNTLQCFRIEHPEFE